MSVVKRRIVITGMGMVSSVGNTVSETWASILSGKSGVSEVTRFDAHNFTTRIAAEVKDFDPTLGLELKEVKKFDLFIQFAVEAARQAVLDSNLKNQDINSNRIGVAVGAGIGGMLTIEKNHKAYLTGGPRKISPFFIPGAIINMAPGIISIKHGFRGPNISIVTACATGLHNIGHAARMIQHNDVDIMIAGGAEMATTEMGIGGFGMMRALSTRNDAPQKASRPWDKDRDGFVLGEGAGIVVLEEYQHAKARGAPIYAELLGFAMSADAYHITSPDEEGVGFYHAMVNTLKDAGISPEEVDYINAHGTSTPAADHIEAMAIKKVFDKHAYRLAVSSTKSMTGHALGAAGAIELIFSILAIRDNIAPPTLNLDTPSEGCDLNFVPHNAVSMRIDTVMSNSFGFGGTNGSIIVRRI